MTRERQAAWHWLMRLVTIGGLVAFAAWSVAARREHREAPRREARGDFATGVDFIEFLRRAGGQPVDDVIDVDWGFDPTSSPRGDE